MRSWPEHSSRIVAVLVGLISVAAQGSYGTRFAKGLAGVLNPTAFNGSGLAFTGCDPTNGCELFYYDMYNEPYLVAVRQRMLRHYLRLLAAAGAQVVCFRDAALYRRVSTMLVGASRLCRTYPPASSRPRLVKCWLRDRFSILLHPRPHWGKSCTCGTRDDRATARRLV